MPVQILCHHCGVLALVSVPPKQYDLTSTDTDGRNQMKSTPERIAVRSVERLDPRESRGRSFVRQYEELIQFNPELAVLY